MGLKETIRVRLATARASAIYNAYLAKADQAREDRRESERHAAALCKTCFYLLARPAPTESKCSGCGALLPNKEGFCVRCARNRDVCRRCGADINLANRKTLR